MNNLLAIVERRLGLTPAGVSTLAALIVGGVVAGNAGNRQVLLLVYGGLLTLALAYALGTRRLDIAAERSEITTRLNQGRGQTVQVTLTATRRTAGLLLRERLPDALGGTRVFALDVLPGGVDVIREYALHPVRRGVHQVGPLEVEWGDPFGLTRRRRVVLGPTTVIVHPAREAAHDRITSRAWEDPPVRPPVSKPWPTGFEFYGMRDYVHGDDPRRIVWRASARTMDAEGNGRFLVREAEQGITDRVRILLDTDRRHHRAGDPSTTFELGVRAAASLGVRHLEDGLSVSLDGNEASLAKHLRGRPAQIPLLDKLAAVDMGGVPFDSAVQRLFLAKDAISHNILLTPHLDQQVATRLRYLVQRGTSLLVVLLQDEDSDPVSAHRAGTLGCSVAELEVGRPIDRTLAHLVTAGVRR